MSVNATKTPDEPNEPYKTPVYAAINYEDLLSSHKNLISLVKILHVKTLIVSEDGDVFVYYNDTEHGPIQIVMD